MTTPTTITIDDIEYVRKDSVRFSTPAHNEDGLEYVIVRTTSAGVHAGYLKSRVGKEVELLNARRIWYWAGAATLSQLATHGTSKPDECKFPTPVPLITLTEAIEIIPATTQARQSIDDVAVWSA